ncbi:MAG: hypothetical protein AAB606_04500 [Patescibacteria group bacterium]
MKKKILRTRRRSGFRACQEIFCKRFHAAFAQNILIQDKKHSYDKPYIHDNGRFCPFKKENDYATIAKRAQWEVKVLTSVRAAVPPQRGDEVRLMPDAVIKRMRPKKYCHRLRGQPLKF